jgi:hypothetical protein
VSIQASENAALRAEVAALKGQLSIAPRGQRQHFQDAFYLACRSGSGLVTGAASKP